MMEKFENIDEAVEEVDLEELDEATGGVVMTRPMKMETYDKWMKAINDGGRKCDIVKGPYAGMKGIVLGYKGRHYPQGKKKIMVGVFKEFKVELENGAEVVIPAAYVDIR